MEWSLYVNPATRLNDCPVEWRRTGEYEHEWGDTILWRIAFAVKEGQSSGNLEPQGQN